MQPQINPLRRRSLPSHPDRQKGGRGEEVEDAEMAMAGGDDETAAAEMAANKLFRGVQSSAAEAVGDREGTDATGAADSVSFNNCATQ